MIFPSTSSIDFIGSGIFRPATFETGGSVPRHLPTVVARMPGELVVGWICLVRRGEGGVETSRFMAMDNLWIIYG